MKLVSLSMQNFMPYKGETTLSFPQDETRNVMVIFGDNMRGKTSLLNALRWAFYGKALGRHLREIPLHELLNKEAAMEGDFVIETAVTFVADGHRYDLRRRAVKRALVAYPSRPEDFEVSVGLQKDGMAVLGHVVESEINRYAPEQVSRFFLFDGELLQEYESLLIEGSEQGRRIKEAIEQVLGVPTLVHGRDEAETLLKSFRRQQQKDLSHVVGLERQVEKQAEFQRRQEALEKDLAALRERLAQAKSERSTLDDELDRVDSIHRAKTRLDLLKRRQGEIDKRLGAIADERQSSLRDAWKDLLQPKLREIKKALYDKQSTMTALMGEKASLEMKRDDLQRMLQNDACPTCGRPAEESKRAEIGAELGRVEVKLRGISVDHLSLGQITAKMREIDRLGASGAAARIHALDEERARLDVELTKVENDAEKTSDEIKGFDTAEIARKRVVRDSLLVEEGRLERDVDDRQREIEKVKRELSIIGKSLEDLPQARAKRSSAMVKICMAVENLFEESIERLRRKLKVEVAAKATGAFAQLTTQKSYSGLEINDNYGLTILDENGGRVTVRSAGAEQIVALSLIDGLARTGRAAGPVVMDTPFGRLDLRHRDNILRYLPTTTGQLVLLVHDGEIRRESDLAPVASRIGATYEIKEVSPRHSKIERVLS
ncbi:DNA sulfur modification protein DndD [Cupriavidus alkaliphilus]|uniref:AAA family ATPase n=1 Tax=Cupriavidus alkaliphilus TaxID=942866 RepID=UPI000DE76BD6|nr:AAA family ATPase [Cupriavidus alkaliphilus]PVY76118.1 DNA sulfur modification protein DndD [Cupriavidus alkaliphilus]